MANENVANENVANENAANKSVKIEMVKSESFKQIYALGVLGGHTTYDFRMAFYNDSIKRPSEKDVTVVERKIEADVILSPIAAKELAIWLSNHVMEYEKTFGTINQQKDVSKQDAEQKEKRDTETQAYIG